MIIDVKETKRERLSDKYSNINVNSNDQINEINGTINSANLIMGNKVNINKGKNS